MMIHTSHPSRDLVAAEDAKAPHDRELVLARVQEHHFTPVASLGTCQKPGGILTGIHKQRESCRCCHQFSEGEEWGGHYSGLR